MSITAALRDHLKTSGPVQPLTGARVYRDERAAQDPLPAIVILLISDPRPRTLSGPQTLRRTRVQIDCLAASRGAADAIAEAVIISIDGIALSATPPFESVRVENVRSDTSRDEPPTTYRTMIDASIWHHST